MAKPVRLYPQPEPMTIDPRLIYLGSGVMGMLFFVVGFVFQNIEVLA